MHITEISNQSTSPADVVGDSPASDSVLISDHIAFIITSVNYAVISEAISLCGIFANIATITVLSKQGFRKRVNISLMGLAVSDLCSVFFKFSVGIAFNPLIWPEDINFIPSEMSVLTVSWPHATFTRIAGWITAFITLERCLCVALPLTIKRILTPRRNLVIVCCIYIGVIAGVMPNYYTTRHAWKYVPEKNKTLLGIAYVDDAAIVDTISLAINNVFSPLTSFGLIIVCTGILVYNLNAKSKWRSRATKNTNIKPGSQEVVSSSSTSISSKDAKVIKLVISISTVFIVSSIPTTCCFVWMAVDQEFNLVGNLRNIYDILASSTFLFESFNSSVNFFIYLRSSTEFREAFNTIFKPCSC